MVQITDIEFSYFLSQNPKGPINDYISEKVSPKVGIKIKYVLV